MPIDQAEARELARQKRISLKRIRVGYGSGPFGFGAVDRDQGVVHTSEHPTVDAMMAEWDRWADWVKGGPIPHG